jgi:tyrosine-protein phosphatase YwqE
MFSFFKKKEPKTNITFNYESVIVDMHSHVLPGIDDGAQNVEESVALVKRMMAMGIKKIIATPHIMADFYRNTPETINNALLLLKTELAQQDIAIPIEAAAEHYFDEVFEKMVDERRLMTMGDNFALFEYPFMDAPINGYKVIQKMIDSGYKPILAHPERYLYMEMEDIEGLRNWGCNIQMNTIALTGAYGKEIRKRAEAMVDRQLIDFIGSDMHNLRHAAALQDALNMPYIEKLLVNYPLKNVMLK